MNENLSNSNNLNIDKKTLKLNLYSNKSTIQLSELLLNNQILIETIFNIPYEKFKNTKILNHIYKFKFTENLMKKTLKNIYSINDINHIKNILYFINNLIAIEQNELKNDKNKILCGFITKFGFKLKNSINYPLNGYYLQFNFKAYKTFSDSFEIISFTNTITNKKDIIFYVKKNILYYLNPEKNYELEKIIYNKTYNIKIKQNNKSFFFNKTNLKIEINDKNYNFDNIYFYPDHNYYLNFGNFFGEFGRINFIDIENSENKNFGINPTNLKGIFKSIKNINKIRISNLILEKNNINDDNIYDIFFEYEETKKLFLKNFGFKYLICLLKIIYDFNNISNEDFNEIIYLIFKLIFNLDSNDINEENNIKNIISIIYFINIILNSLEKFKFEKKIIELIKNNINLFKKRNNLLNYLLILIINQKFLDSNNNSLIIEILIYNINLSYLNNNFYDIYLNSLINLFFQNYDKKISNIIINILSKLNNDLIIKYFLYFQYFSIEENKFKESYKLNKILLFLTNYKLFSIINNNQSELILNRYFYILKLENNEKNNNKYLNKLKSIIIQLIDVYFIKDYYNNFNNQLNQENNSYYKNLKYCIQFIINLNNYSEEIIRSILLIIINDNNIENKLKYIKLGEKNKNFQYFNNIIQNYEIINEIFNLIFKIQNNQNFIDVFNNFIKTFCNECINKIKYNKNESAKEILENYKILGNFFQNMLIITLENENIIFDLNYLNEIIINTIFILNEPFYYNLINNLIILYLNQKYENEKNEKLLNYIYNLLIILIELIREDQPILKKLNQKEKNYFYIQTKNLIILFYYIFNNFVNYNIKNDNKIFLKIKEIIKTFFNKNLKNGILYSKLLFLDNKILLEIILDIFLIYYSKFDENDNENEIFNKIFNPEFIKEKNIFFYLDSNILPKIEKEKYFQLTIAKKLDKILPNFNCGSLNTFNCSILMLKKLILLNFENIINKTFKFNLTILKEKIIFDLQNFYFSKMKSNLLINSLNTNYNNIKNEIENLINLKKLNNENLNKLFNDKNLNNFNNNFSLTTPKKQEKNFFENKNILIKKKLDFFEINEINLNNIKINLNDQKLINEIDFEIFLNDMNLENFLNIHKIKNYFYQNFFSLDYLNIFYYNDSLIKFILNNFNIKTNNSFLNNNFFFHFPVKIKNYVTKTFLKPFLKLNRNFFNEKTFKISHNFIKNNNNNNKIIIKEIPININLNKYQKFNAELITNQGSIFINYFLLDEFILIKNEKIDVKLIKEKYLLTSQNFIEKNKFIIIPYLNINEIFSKRFCYVWCSIEIYCNNNKTYLLNLLNKDNFNIFKNFIKNKHIKFIENLKDEFKKLNFVQKWKNNEISNFDFINLLNKYSSRSFNDLTQYPIFPWLFNDYKTIFNLNDIKKENLRLFEFPISAQKEENRLIISNRFNDVKCHHQIHYSTEAIVLFYLVRISPFTENQILFQSNSFDNPDRLFISFNEVKNILENFNDNRELIPEIFYLVEMYYNINLCYFGQKQNKEIVNNIKFPNEIFNAAHFIYYLRIALENYLISEELNKWINNIFGINQNDNNFLNVFFWQSYEEIFIKKYYEIINKIKHNEEINDLKLKNDFIENLNYSLVFGQCPLKILDKKLESKKIEKKKDFFDYENVYEKIFISINKNKKENFLSFFNLNFKDEKINYFYHFNNFIYILTNKIKFYCFSIFDYSLIYFINLEKFNFFLINENFFSIFNEILLISNFYDNSIKFFKNDELIFSTILLEFVSCVCKISNEEFLLGNSNGLIQKFLIEFDNKNNRILSINSISKIYKCHRKKINQILYVKNLDVFISISDDNFIFIRNINNFDLIISIKLYSNLIKENKKIYVNKFNTIFLLNENKNKIDAFSLNGLKLCDSLKNVNINLIEFVDDFRLFYINLINKKLIEICPVYFNKVVNEWELKFLLDEKGDFNDKILYFFYDNNEKCLHFIMENNKIFKFNLNENKTNIKNKNEINNNNNNENNNNNNNNNNKNNESSFKFLFFDFN